MKKISSTFVFSAILLCLHLLTFAQDYTYYNNLAKEEYDKKKYNNVIDYANKSLNASRNGAAYWYRGMARYYLNNYTDAADDFTNAISYYSSDNSSLGNLYYWRALCRYGQENYKLALPDFESANSYGYENNKSNMYWTMAYCYYKTGDYKQSEEFYTSAMNYTSDNSILAQLYKGRGDIKYDLFKIKDAINDYIKAIQYDPGYSNAFWARAIARAANLEYDLAVGDYTSAINIVERNSKTGSENDLSILYSNRGWNQYRSGKYDEGKADLQKSLNINPNYDIGNRNMGDVLDKQKNYKEAIRYYLRAASLYSRDADRASCYRSLYFCSLKMLDYTQALSYINSAIKIDPEYGSYYSDRAHVYSTKKNYAATLADYSKTIEYYTNDKYDIYKNTRIGLYSARAQVKIKMKDNTGALTDLQEAVKEDTFYYDSFYELGRFYKQVLKQNDKASANLQKAAEMSIVKGDTTSSYAYAKLIKGDKQEAFGVMARLIKKVMEDKERLKWEYHNAACIYALAGDSAKAFQFLDKSFVAGYDDYDHLINDRDLESLMHLPQWKVILTKYKVPQPK